MVARTFDDLVIGAGMGGLTVSALLAAQGRRVLVVEAHDVPGGYAHTFEVGHYRFCAQVHYIFGCGPGEPVHELLRRTGLDEAVRLYGGDARLKWVKSVPSLEDVFVNLMTQSEGATA